jgi:hypothetical protein
VSQGREGCAAADKAIAFFAASLVPGPGSVTISPRNKGDKSGEYFSAQLSEMAS